MSRRTKALPNFFIVGAPKAGTTSLYHYLDQHPQIYMSPVKEPNYFASEIRPENVSEKFQEYFIRDLHALREYLSGPMCEKRFGGIVSEWGDYLKLFRNVKGERAVGEASVCYLWSQTAAANIFSRIPDAKILMVLRNPAERAFSQYLHVLGTGLVRKSFREEVQASLRRKGEKFSVLHPFLEFGLYYGQLRRYLKFFPRESVRIYLYEEYQKQPLDTLADTLRFLNVDLNFMPETSEKHLQAQIPKAVAITYLLKKCGIWQRFKELSPHAFHPFLRRLAFRKRESLVMDSKDRKYVLDFYREDIMRLGDLLNRDLSAWLH